jgi:uncharacterized protein (TIGR03083 family)
MSDQVTNLLSLAPILAADRFPALGRDLVALLRSLSDEQWNLPTVALRWTVRDIAAHLLDTGVRRLSSARDRFMPPPPDRPIDEYGALVAFLNDINEQWVVAMRRLSPRVLTDFLESLEPQLADLMAAIDPWARAPISVAWAGEKESPAWFDVARELTERWHHQQQIRLAVGAPPLDDPWMSEPIFDTFIRALPHGYRNVTAPAGTELVVRIEGKKVYAYTLRAGEGGGWALLAGEGADPVARIVLAEEPAWLLFTKGLRGEEAKRRARIEGDPALTAAFFEILAIMG